ncbi:MAG TPA: J domain-containing protein [Ignavibacteriales bacterium]|nr:J domain-containing protein [Ignavibacteriales bacterium]
MSRISKLRDAGDYLLNIARYEEAYEIYLEIYRQIWTELGHINNIVSEFTNNNLSEDINTAVEFQNLALSPAIHNALHRKFNLNSDQTLNEFIFIIYGRLRCICNSEILRNKISRDLVLKDFLILYGLILHTSDEQWINYLFAIASPIVEDGRLKKIKIKYSQSKAIDILIDSAKKLKQSDWNVLNSMMLSYSEQTGDFSSQFYYSLKSLAGSSYANDKDKYKSKGGYKRQESYERHEKYERYEKHEKYEKRTHYSEKEFDPASATEFEKDKYYGKILGLAGRVTKSQIRRKYLELISKYHPDKVQDLGDELIQLAEHKAKQINEAYEWLKIKHKL